jgi:hypothetical protein
LILTWLYKSIGPGGKGNSSFSSPSNLCKSSGRVYIANSPLGVLGHNSFGRSQYNSTPFSSGPDFLTTAKEHALVDVTRNLPFGEYRRTL